MWQNCKCRISPRPHTALTFALCRRLTIQRLQRQIKESGGTAPVANSLAEETEKSKTDAEELQQASNERHLPLKLLPLTRFAGLRLDCGWARQTAKWAGANSKWHPWFTAQPDTNHHGVPIAHFGPREGVQQLEAEYNPPWDYCAGWKPQRSQRQDCSAELWKGARQNSRQSQPTRGYYKDAVAWYQSHAGWSQLLEWHQQQWQWRETWLERVSCSVRQKCKTCV